MGPVAWTIVGFVLGGGVVFVGGFCILGLLAEATWKGIFLNGHPTRQKKSIK